MSTATSTNRERCERECTWLEHVLIVISAVRHSHLINNRSAFRSAAETVWAEKKTHNRMVPPSGCRLFPDHSVFTSMASLHPSQIT